TYVKLINENDNAFGEDPEALYVLELNVPTGSTLDLNGLTVYARTINTQGTILNGEVIQVTSGFPYTDLTVTNVAAPAAAAADEQISLEWTVTNSGDQDTDASTWYDRIILSTDAQVGNSDDMVLGTFQHDGTLGPEESYTATAVVTLPAGLRGDFQLFVVTDATNAVYEFFREHNNASAASPITLNSPALPDLQVYHLSISPEAGIQSGATVTVSWDDANTGDADISAAWYDHILVINTTTGETLVSQTLQHDPATAGVLSAGESLSRSFTFTLPEGTTGTGEIRVVITADSGGQIVEDNASGTAETNNTAEILFTSTSAAYPDIAAGNIAIPETASGGQTLTVTWDTTNAGDTALTGTWTERIYLSATPGGSGTLVGSVIFSEPLAAGETVARSAEITLPTTVSSDLYVVVTLVSNDGIHEINTDNNTASSAAPLRILAPDLSVTAVTGPAAVLFGQSMEVSWTVANTGTAPASGIWTDRVYLSSDGTLNGAILLGTVTHSEPLAIGASYTERATFMAPTLTGSYTLLVMTNVHGNPGEVSSANNSALAADPTLILATCTVTVRTDTELAPNGTAISLYGHAALTTTGEPAANQTVSIRILTNGTRRVITATTDANGDFTAIFTPLVNEAGHYEVAAAHPDVTEDVVQDSFELIGMSTSAASAVRVSPGTPITGQVTIRNLSSIDLTGLSATVAQTPDDVSVVATIADSLPEEGTTTLTYEISALDNTRTSGTVVLHLATDQGATLDVGISTTVVPLTAVLSASEGTLTGGVVRGQQAFYTFTLTNTGGIATGDLSVDLPDWPWFSLATSPDIASLNPGESTTVTLALTPSEDLALGRYTGAIAVQGQPASLSVGFDFTVVSAATGDVQVTVVDDYTFYAEGSPNVEGATVTLRDPYDNSIVIAQTVTDASGVIAFAAIPEGVYLLEVSADQHGTSKITIPVRPGIVNATNIFIARQTITYSWEVVPTTIQDQYEIKLVSTFETNVPVPVVTIDAPDQIPELLPGETAQIDVVITNHGLIAAQGVVFEIPELAGYVFTPLVTDLGVLHAQSSVTVPIAVMRKPAPVVGTDDCMARISVNWNYICGSEYVWRQSSAMLKLGTAACTVQTLPVIPGSGGWAPLDTGEAVGSGTLLSGSGSFVPVSIVNTVACDPDIVSPGESDVCATVKIQIDQTAVMTRNAFAGTLEIDNNSTAGAIQGVRVELQITDENGNLANDKFGITDPVLSGLSGVDGSGVIGIDSAGSAVYTFIPNREAAPEVPTVYSIGGTLRYISPENGEEITVPLYPSAITVYPDALLELHYFQQRDVIGDDPFTEDIEPSEAFALGLLVSNTGNGTAQNLSITSAQPKIIENEKGLLIDFQIIGTRVGDQEASPSLGVDLGDIAPGQTQQALWLLTSSLQGRFTDYEATFEYVNGMGDSRLSLIDSATIHELIHTVRADRPGDDNLYDFLVNDDKDVNVLPDTLYLSDGTTAVVNVADTVSVDHSASLSNMTVQLTANMTSGWSYLRTADPGAGYKLHKVVRSDGKEILVGDNAWQTNYVFAETDQSYRREERLHLLDYDSTGVYTLYFVLDDSVAPEVTAISPVESPATGPISSIDVTFSEAIDLSTLDWQNLVLTCNDGDNLINDSVTVSLVSGSTYRIGNLSDLTAEDGNYRFTVNAAGVQDFGANNGTNSLSTTWAKGTVHVAVVSVGDGLAAQCNTPVDTVEVVFSKAIAVSTFTTDDITLTCDGVAIDPSGLSIETQDGITFRISGLSALTSVEGVYALTLSGTGITDPDGTAGTGALTRTWVLDTTAPTATGITRLATNPRNIVVPFIDVTFSEPIDETTFDWQDLVLTLNDGTNLITSEVTIQKIDDVTFRIANFNWVVGREGTYTFTVSGAGITDRAGNAGTGSVSETWVMDTTAPTLPDHLRIVSATGMTSTTGMTNSLDFSILGDLSESGLRVDLTNKTGTTVLASAQMTDASLILPVTLTAVGRHELMLRLTDAAGNVTETAFTVFVDTLAPMVKAFVGVPSAISATPVDAIDIV
ncbi:Ig-like domain-containing protein, partial [Desulfosarcina sp. OttesenSCG-928-B08]|nr:Ig-like domain-containing protein [Desulfosarcina sp. OttesenSCG-928-B08]